LICHKLPLIRKFQSCPLPRQSAPVVRVKSDEATVHIKVIRIDEGQGILLTVLAASIFGIPVMPQTNSLLDFMLDKLFDE